MARASAVKMPPEANAAHGCEGARRVLALMLTFSADDHTLTARQLVNSKLHDREDFNTLYSRKVFVIMENDGPPTWARLHLPARTVTRGPRSPRSPAPPRLVR